MLRSTQSPTVSTICGQFTSIRVSLGEIDIVHKDESYIYNISSGFNKFHLDKS